MSSLTRLLAGVLVATATVSAQDPDHATSRTFNRALGVECEFCHAPADADDPAPRTTAGRMIAMVSALNERLADLGGRVTCWTCHSGSRAPLRLPRTAWEAVRDAWPSGVAASDQVKLTMAVYTASVGRTCAGCHEHAGAGPATEEAVALVRTMNTLFPIMEKFLPPAARTQCFMCHKGRPHPQIAPRD